MFCNKKCVCYRNVHLVFYNKKCVCVCVTGMYTWCSITKSVCVCVLQECTPGVLQQEVCMSVCVLHERTPGVL